MSCIVTVVVQEINLKLQRQNFRRSALIGSENLSNTNIEMKTKLFFGLMNAFSLENSIDFLLKEQ